MVIHEHLSNNMGWNFNFSNRDQVSYQQIGQFCTWYLLKFVNIILVFLYKHALNCFFNPLGRVEAIKWENFVPEKRDSGSAKEESPLPGWNVSHVVAGYNRWGVYSTDGIPTKGDEFHHSEPGSCNQHLRYNHGITITKQCNILA